MSLAVVALAGVIGIFGLVRPVTGFGTINEPVVLGQHNEHEMVTRLAFQCPSGQKSDGMCFEPRSLDQLAGYHRDVMGVAVPGAGFNGAVGAPDTLDPVPEGPEAHCDDADFVDIPGYPQTRQKATANLQVCVDHMRARFRQAWVSAENLVDERNRIRLGTVELANAFGGDCNFAFPSLQINYLARPKCSTLEGFGRALHGVQDFYSHSNWADKTDTSKPISASNPPGLAMNGTAPFLNLRAIGPIPEDQVPRNLTTGCFAIPDSTPGTGSCTGRVTHNTLNKDHGVINLDATFGEVGVFSLRAAVIPENFHNAVTAAVQASREAWGSLRDELRHRYGVVAGNLMICALVRDDPIKDCRTRTVAVALDSSQKSVDDGTLELEQKLAKELNSRLTMHGLDRVEVIYFSETPSVLYPLGYPDSARFEVVKPGGRANIGQAIEAAIDDSIAAQPETYTDRAAVVILTAGAERGDSPEDLRPLAEHTLDQVRRASREGIRIHYGCINPSSTQPPKPLNDECLPGAQGLIPLVLKTGGTFAFLNPSSARITSDFINVVTHRGLAWTDEYLPDQTRLYPGISLAVLLDSETPSKSLFYPASAGERLNLTIRDRAFEGQGTVAAGGGIFSVTLYDDNSKQQNVPIAIYHCTSCGTEPLNLVYEATEDIALRITAELGEQNHGYHTHPADHVNAQVTDADEESPAWEPEVVFTIELVTTMPDKEETIIETKTSVVSDWAEATVEGARVIGKTLTSETVEILEETETMDGTVVLTETESFVVPDDVTTSNDENWAATTQTIEPTTVMAGNLSEIMQDRNR
ncbi:hypothetical protein QBC42DRAFT_260637 [Cladorrhinum samala]|uniref:VWFA domain-containing protein n=1 Tax=Cladorrhinum samala TaxID=585594 RepID=A0AAV9I4M8_9PEZI|nr:hypothetical protein QBC42DRAFT_260637 [Cladorrhinum samala]